MADPHHTPENATNFSKEVDDPVTLCIVYAAVVGLAFVTIGFSSMGIGKFALPFQLTIACIQAGLVAYFFMHLRQGDRVVILTALSSIFWMGILFVLFMADYATRFRIVG